MSRHSERNQIKIKMYITSQFILYLHSYKTVKLNCIIVLFNHKKFPKVGIRLRKIIKSATDVNVRVITPQTLAGGAEVSDEITLLIISPAVITI